MYRIETKHRTEIAITDDHLCHDFGLSSVLGHPNADLVEAILEALALKPASFQGIDIVVQNHNDFAFRRGAFFASAEPGGGHLVYRTTQVGFWELFQLQLDGYTISANGDRLARIPLGSFVDPQVVAKVPERTEILSLPASLHYEDSQWFEESSTSFFAVRSGALTPNNGVVRVKEKYLATKFDAHGTVFDEAGFYNNPHFVFRRAAEFSDFSFSGKSILIKHSKMQAFCYLDGSFTLPFDGNSSNYYHFLIDGIVHLSMLRRLGFNAPPIMFSSRKGLLPWQKDMLDLVGLSTILLVDGDKTEVVKVADMHWIENTGVNNLPAEELVHVRNIVRIASGTVNARSERKLYIKRKPGARAMINAEEIEIYLSARGYECIDLEGLSVPHQLRLFSEAKVVIGAHGAGLANILFCNPGAKLIDIIPGTGEVRNFFWILCEKIGLLYRFIRSSAPNYESAMYLDLNLLKALLRDECL